MIIRLYFTVAIALIGIAVLSIPSTVGSRFDEIGEKAGAVGIAMVLAFFLYAMLRVLWDK